MPGQEAGEPRAVTPANLGPCQAAVWRQPRAHLAFGCRALHLLDWQQRSSWINDRTARPWRGLSVWPWPSLPKYTGALGSLGLPVQTRHMKDVPEPLSAAWLCRSIMEQLQLTGKGNTFTGKWNTFIGTCFKLEVGEPATGTCRNCLRLCFHWGHKTHISSLLINQEVDSVSQLKRNSVVQETKLKCWLFDYLAAICKQQRCLTSVLD